MEELRGIVLKAVEEADERLLRELYFFLYGKAQPAKA